MLIFLIVGVLSLAACIWHLASLVRRSTARPATAPLAHACARILVAFGFTWSVSYFAFVSSEDSSVSDWLAAPGAAALLVGLLVFLIPDRVISIGDRSRNDVIRLSALCWKRARRRVLCAGFGEVPEIWAEWRSWAGWATAAVLALFVILVGSSMSSMESSDPGFVALQWVASVALIWGSPLVVLGWAVSSAITRTTLRRALGNLAQWGGYGLLVGFLAAVAYSLGFIYSPISVAGGVGEIDVAHVVASGSAWFAIVFLLVGAIVSCGRGATSRGSGLNPLVSGLAPGAVVLAVWLMVGHIFPIDPIVRATSGGWREYAESAFPRARDGLVDSAMDEAIASISAGTAFENVIALSVVLMLFASGVAGLCANFRDR